MTLAILNSRASIGINSPPVSVEVHLANGLPAFSIVGLPEKAVKESKDRVRSALLTMNFDFPARRITVNLSPADLPKEGGRFDLPIALGILAATGQLPKNKLDEFEFAGELALSGELRPFKGCLPFALATHKTGRKLIIPQENADEAVLAENINVLPAGHLLDVYEHLTSKTLLQNHVAKPVVNDSSQYLDLSDVRGQEHAKRALEIAAAGGHSLLMLGPPGTGKSMLASRLPGILPKMTQTEAIEIAAIISINKGNFEHSQWKKRPFRSPHHTASGVALVGGGNPPRPGEISLSHNGVLFLDELPEFNRRVLESLREPCETGTVTISRAARQAEYPARFQLIAAMNPCPCGYLGDPDGRCRCTADQVQRYLNRLSGPFLDRIDMHIEVARLPDGILTSTSTEIIESSSKVQKRVEQARERQLNSRGIINSILVGKKLEQCCELSLDNQQLLEKAIKQLKLSARAYHRILRVSRTIADLANEESIKTQHITEALNFRHCDRNHVI